MSCSSAKRFFMRAVCPSKPENLPADSPHHPSRVNTQEQPSHSTTAIRDNIDRRKVGRTSA
jgi:hypothetical protein